MQVHTYAAAKRQRRAARRTAPVQAVRVDKQVMALAREAVRQRGYRRIQVVDARTVVVR